MFVLGCQITHCLVRCESDVLTAASSISRKQSYCKLRYKQQIKIIITRVLKQQSKTQNPGPKTQDRDNCNKKKMMNLKL